MNFFYFFKKNIKILVLPSYLIYTFLKMTDASFFIFHFIKHNLIIEGNHG